MKGKLISALQSPRETVFMNRLAKKRSHGQAIIEFTLLLPLIIIIVGGLTDLGLAFYISVGVENAVREGARVAVTVSPLVADDPTVKQVVKDRIPPASQFALKSGYPTNSLPTSATCEGNVTVTAEGTYNYMFLQYIGFTPIAISRSTTMRYEGNPICPAGP
jgi:Flp pilus assembly protein TadG